MKRALALLGFLALALSVALYFLVRRQRAGEHGPVRGVATVASG